MSGTHAQSVFEALARSYTDKCDIAQSTYTAQPRARVRLDFNGADIGIL